MKEKFFGLHLDFVGFWASMLCAVHCMAVPMVVTFGTTGGLTWLSNPWLEFGFIGMSVVVASWSLTKSYFQHHRRFTAITVVVGGFILLILSRFVEHEWEPILAVLGGVTIAAAHLINWQLCRHCNSSCALKKKRTKSPTLSVLHSVLKKLEQ